MKILDRLPIGEEPATIEARGELVLVKRFQIVLWASLNGSPPFPAILDTGHSHNASITESQLEHWTGLRSRQLPLVGSTRLKGARLWQLRADLRLHRNRPGTRELAGGSFLLDLDQGLTLSPEGSARLPLIGLRALVCNRLMLAIDGGRRHVNLRSAGWFGWRPRDHS